MRQIFIDDGIITKNQDEMDQSGEVKMFETKQLSVSEIKALQDKAYKKFYLRPKYLVKKVCDIKNMKELSDHIKEAVEIAKMHFVKRP